MEEIWKEIEGFPNYNVSNYGRLKRLRGEKETMLNPCVNSRGYYHQSLRRNNKQETKRVHQLVAIAFLNHKPCGMKFVINHKDFNKLNNHIDNLEIVTTRQNANKKHLSSSSIYTGVFKQKGRRKWRAGIQDNDKFVYLGNFESELQASEAYQKRLREIELR